MIVELNGLPGVGKFTIARALAPMLGARLVDNHTIYNPAFATTTFKSPQFYDTVRAVRTIVFRQLAKLPKGQPVVLTVAPGRDVAWGREWQMAIRELADQREAKLLGVRLECSHDELKDRMTTPTRALLGKVVEPGRLRDGFERPVLLDHCDEVLQLDLTTLEAAHAARRIKEWLDSHDSSVR